MQRFQNDFKVTVSTKELLETLIANKGAHIESYKKALANWRLDLLAKLQSFTSRITAGESRFNLTLDPAPVSMEKDYELAIAMVSWNKNDTMILDQQQFNAFVRDDWEWKQSWSLTNSKYLG